MDWLGPACALASSFTWVIGSGAYTALSQEHPPERVNFNRAVVATTLFAVATFIRRDQVMESLASVGGSWTTSVMWLSISILASYAVGDIFFMRAAPLIGFPATQAVGALFPLWATLAAWLFLGESVTQTRALGVVLCVLGVVLIILGRAHQTGRELRGAFAKGLLFALICSAFWGVNSYGAAQGGKGFDPAFGNLVRMSVAVLVCFAMTARVTPGHYWLRKTDYRKFGLIIAGESFLGSMAYVYGLSHSPMAVGATLSSLAPLLSLPVSWALGWEKFSWLPLVGAGVVMAGLYCLL